MLVPMPVPESELPFTTEQFLERLAAQSGQAFRPIIIRQTAQDALCATIRALTDAGVGDPEIALVAIWLAKNGLPITTDSAQRWYRLCDWATDPQNILAALAAAKEHERKSAEAVAELVEFKKQLGYPT